MEILQEYTKELSRRDTVTFLITQEMFNRFIHPKFQELRPGLVPQLSALIPPYIDVRAVDRTTAEHPYEYNFRITKRHKNGNICREIIMGWREFSIARRLQHRDVVIFSFDANPFQMVVRIPEDRLRPDQRILVPVPNRNRKPKPSIPTCDDAYGAMQALYKMSRSKETYSVPRNVQEGQQQQQMNSGTGRAAGYMGRLHLNDQMYGHFGNTYRGGSGFRLNYHNPESTWNSWQTADFKYESKGRNNGFFGYRITNYDCLMSLARGPRSKDVKTQQEETISTIPDKEQFNKEDIPETYVDAKFFVIKSYGEDNVHKSIKYNVWASTPNGNKKLDAAYQEAKGKPDSCPVFLLFSVNASGQFVGLAEMVGPVDFNNTMDFWLEDKWTGCFPVKWHIVKDVPNSLLKHITLENNDNKPVTNSRDTQEVKLEQGVQVLQIFKSHLTNTSILDDFEFYEARQKALQEKKASRLQCQKQVKNEKIPGDVNVADKVLTDGGKHSCTYGQFKMHQGSAARPQSSADVTKGVNGEKAGSAAEVASA